MRVSLSMISLALGLVACASDRAVTRLGADHYRVKCALRLHQCLEHLAKACEHGYTVVAAEERRELVGPSPYPTEVLKSDAEVRCRQAEGLFTGAPSASAGAADAGAPAP